MKSKFYFILIIGFLFTFANCRNQAEKTPEKEPLDIAEGTPVTIGQIEIGPLAETVELNATSTFLFKTFVKSTSNGYLKTVSAQIGDYVKKGQELFVIQTKEAAALGNLAAEMDTTFHFNGFMRVNSTGNGYVTAMPFRVGDYVQDGEQLAAISDPSSLVFLLDLPYEFTRLATQNRAISLRLPDGSTLAGTLTDAMPTMDAASQTQQYIIRVRTQKSLPENLVALAKLTKIAKKSAISIEKEAILTDEQQKDFWIMKLLDDSTAVKIPIQKGIETANRVEILSPRFAKNERILLTGNFGLADTARVVILEKEEEE
jgi:multidrug efflux pump subunit AcrA (membrane-fusion protein)